VIIIINIIDLAQTDEGGLATTGLAIITDAIEGEVHRVALESQMAKLSEREKELLSVVDSKQLEVGSVFVFFFFS
jgi:hypothetical protein